MICKILQKQEKKYAIIKHAIFQNLQQNGLLRI